jgi:hypothetical protein
LGVSFADLVDFEAVVLLAVFLEAVALFVLAEEAFFAVVVLLAVLLEAVLLIFEALALGLLAVLF